MADGVTKGIIKTGHDLIAVHWFSFPNMVDYNEKINTG